MVDDILGFFSTANRLKWIARRGWVAKVGVTEPESVADHCYLTALMSLVLADLKGLNSAKAVKMALLHDLAESVLGDYMPEEIDAKYKHEQERDVIRALLQRLPAGVGKRYERLWREYKRGRSGEARLVREVDKLEMANQARDYMEKGYRLELIQQFLRSADTQIRDRTLRRLLKSLK